MIFNFGDFLSLSLYIYIYMCVCVCDEERKGMRERDMYMAKKSCIIF